MVIEFAIRLRRVIDDIFFVVPTAIWIICLAIVLGFPCHSSIFWDDSALLSPSPFSRAIAVGFLSQRIVEIVSVFPSFRINKCPLLLLSNTIPGVLRVLRAPEEAVEEAIEEAVKEAVEEVVIVSSVLPSAYLLVLGCKCLVCLGALLFKLRFSVFDGMSSVASWEGGSSRDVK